MKTNSKPPEDPTVIVPGQLLANLRTVFEAIARQGWGPWHHRQSLLASDLDRPMFPADTHTIKTAGRVLGDRVMQLRPADSAGDQTRPWGITCTRGRWRWISQDDMAPIAVSESDLRRRNGDGDYSLANSIKQLTSATDDPRCGHAYRVLREVGIESAAHLSGSFEAATNIARMLTAEAMWRDLSLRLATRLSIEIAGGRTTLDGAAEVLLAECRAAGLDVRGEG